MRITVLGNAGRYLAPLGGGSSYLVEHAGTRVLLDAGGGARAALERLGAPRLDAVVLSHFHFDHVLDLPTLRDALDERGLVLVPPGERRRLDALARAYVFDGPFSLPGTIIEARPDVVHAIGDLTLVTATAQHSAPAMATRLEADGRRLVYASDTAPCATVQALARDADLLLMHTLLPRVETESEHARIHATAQTAARLALAAGARRLLLSHRYHGSRDAEMLDAAAREGAAAELAREGASYDV